VSDISHIDKRGMGILKQNRKQAGLDHFNIKLSQILNNMVSEFQNHQAVENNIYKMVGPV